MQWKWLNAPVSRDFEQTRTTEVAGTLRRAVRIQGFTSVSSEWHTECPYYFDFYRERLTRALVRDSIAMEWF
jgi:hypothetical protein